MKITEEGVQYDLKTPRYHYNEYVAGVLFPRSISFTGTFKGQAEVQGLRFEDWVGMLIHNKILIPSGDALKPEQEEKLRGVSPLADPFLVVEDTDPAYITKLLFTILNSLLQTESQLISLKCKQ
jgi:hypothetical protein